MNRLAWIGNFLSELTDQVPSNALEDDVRFVLIFALAKFSSYFSLFNLASFSPFGISLSLSLSLVHFPLSPSPG